MLKGVFHSVINGLSGVMGQVCGLDKYNRIYDLRYSIWDLMVL